MAMYHPDEMVCCPWKGIRININVERNIEIYICIYIYLYVVYKVCIHIYIYIPYMDDKYAMDGDILGVLSQQKSLNVADQTHN